jgi:ribosomal protein S18 acetylase RimI-like enzyme
VIEIRPYGDADEEQVVRLWRLCGLTRPWNDANRDIARKLSVQPELFLVAVRQDRVVACVMAGYDGHRGWMNYLAVHPDVQESGIGRAIVERAESLLRALGCPEVNLQIRRENLGARGFYTNLGYSEDEVISMGKRLERDGPGPADPPPEERSR